MKNPVYIHYGSTKFDPSRGFPIRNANDWSKPIGGLWASRIVVLNPDAVVPL